MRSERPRPRAVLAAGLLAVALAQGSSAAAVRAKSSDALPPEAAQPAEVALSGQLVGSSGPAIVYLVDDRDKPAPVRKSVRQEHLRFVPDLLAIPRGSTVEFVNNDETSHNIFSPGPQDPFDLGTYGRGARSHTFLDAGPHVILCNVHVEMVAWILVLDTARSAAVQPDGSFTLRLPPGHHKLALFRPRKPQLELELDLEPARPRTLTWDLGTAP